MLWHLLLLLMMCTKTVIPENAKRVKSSLKKNNV